MVCVESKTRSQREVDTAVAEGGGVWLVLHVIFQYSVGSTVFCDERKSDHGMMTFGGLSFDPRFLVAS
jgi:hypothetical protein